MKNKKQQYKQVLVYNSFIQCTLYLYNILYNVKPTLYKHSTILYICTCIYNSENQLESPVFDKPGSK